MKSTRAYIFQRRISRISLRAATISNLEEEEWSKREEKLGKCGLREARRDGDLCKDYKIRSENW